MIKKIIKNIVANNFSVFSYPIIVNSYGRSGSTLLSRAIARKGVKPQVRILNKIASGSISKYAWDLNSVNIKNGYIYKTHDYPPKVVSNNQARMLYTFAKPEDVIISLLRLYDQRGKTWMKKHYDHMKIPFKDFKEIVNKDQLQLEAHLNSWLNQDQLPVAFIRYEAMWEHQKKISDYLGFDVSLPKYKERKATYYEDDRVKKVNETYDRLNRKVNKLDDFFIVNSNLL
jgi:hypothetical protein